MINCGQHAPRDDEERPSVQLEPEALADEEGWVQLGRVSPGVEAARPRCSRKRVVTEHWGGSERVVGVGESAAADIPLSRLLRCWCTARTGGGDGWLAVVVVGVVVWHG